MKMTINGDSVEVPDSIEVITDLLHHFGLDQKVVMVELNNLVIDRKKHDIQTVEPGDVIELVQFVGGG
ncbi:sulfur carrier protein ThiS [Jeotgalibacillus soli]|uniref:Sulfur carrier protein ThiS n=1 Tax=Jeotgalibacillus soli TaxID=889306 RepID=A0A0C2RP91_9BACL|nr:sulfur carrier protein ThiS [Jeotgalibacillus soli]KIL52060.1 sulfur carrier protein ThiS [Jeotgalibacillus soli]